MLLVMPMPAVFSGVTVTNIPPQPVLGGVGKVNSVSWIPQLENSVDKEELITSTQYVMSIVDEEMSSVNGADHVR